MSGLTCAATLARMSKKVLVLEQHPDVAGGGTHMFDLKGFPFDSGLHYTVPWSIPLFALTTLKKPKNCLPFDLMTETDGTIDKIYLVDENDGIPIRSELGPFCMKYQETHVPLLYTLYPDQQIGLNTYFQQAEASMQYVKYFLFAKLLPLWLQPIFWKFCVSETIQKAANITAKQLLPQFLTNTQLISLLSSMWIDTGGRPDTASFMLTASVFRGISMEGGVYPRGGSSEMAKELVTVIEVSTMYYFY
jgi:all-trans-retinol 13,14-reductase